MKDPRIQKLAANLVGYSVDVQPGENVLVEMIGTERDLMNAIIEEVGKKGGNVFVQLTDRTVQRAMLKNATEDMMKTWAEIDLNRMKQMDCYIGIRAGENVNDLSDVPEDKMKMYNALYSHPVHSEQRVKHTKWVVLRYPNASMAQLANTSTEAFEDFYFDVCNLDYAKMDKAQDALADLMNRTDKVRITGPGTDLSFSIKNIGAVKCSGQKTFRMARFTARLFAIPSTVQSATMRPRCTTALRLKTSNSPSKTGKSLKRRAMIRNV